MRVNGRERPRAPPVACDATVVVIPGGVCAAACVACGARGNGDFAHQIAELTKRREGNDGGRRAKWTARNPRFGGRVRMRNQSDAYVRRRTGVRKRSLLVNSIGDISRGVRQSFRDSKQRRGLRGSGRQGAARLGEETWKISRRRIRARALAPPSSTSLDPALAARFVRETSGPAAATASCPTATTTSDPRR